MGKIFFTSDLHLCHDREFLYKPRGFENIEQMNIFIEENWNRVVMPEDQVWILGDIMLNDNNKGIEIFKSLNGDKRIIIGNHDTGSRLDLYRDKLKISHISYATLIRYKRYSFYLSHYPTITSSLEKDNLKKCVINLYGHTHQKNNFFQDMPFMYHVGMDSHNCIPILIDDIILDCENKVKECIKQL